MTLLRLGSLLLLSWGILTTHILRLAFAQNLEDSVSQCLWTECINDTPQTCPGGTRDGQPCNQQCPPGYTTTWAKAGNGTCDPGSTRFFCCPENAAPTCAVVSHHEGVLDVVKCSGKCASNQVKIGADITGCAYGTNDICCDRSTSLVAQESCSWNNTCTQFPTCQGNVNQPNMITSTPFGDGGPPCRDPTQFKALCCSNPNPYPHDTCTWYSGGPQPGPCSGICPSGKTLVTTDNSGCTSGTKVLCCNGVLPEDSVIAQWEFSLAAFAKDPSCPTWEALSPDNDNSTSPPAGYVDEKRESPIDGGSSKRDLGYLGGYEMMSELLYVINGTTAGEQQMRASWDRLIGPTNLRSDEYEAIFNANPELDASELLEQYLCAWEDARQNVADLNNVGTALCHIPSVDGTLNVTARDIALTRRVFNQDLTETRPTTDGNSEINTGALINRIVTTSDVPYLYSRLIRYFNQDQQFDEVILEVAYDLRNTPDLRESPDDIFAVFHFHVEEMNPGPVDPNGNLYPRVRTVQVFHGQRVWNPNTDDPLNLAEWRVDGWRRLPAGARNSRTNLLNCPVGQYWWPGLELNTFGNQQDPGEQEMQAFGNLLRNQGILVPNTFHNWDVDHQDWYWDDENRPANPDELPNTGTFLNGHSNPPADMRGAITGGGLGPMWPEYLPPPPGPGSR